MSDTEDDGLDLFQEPKDYYQPEKEPTKVEHKTLAGKVLQLNLVGHNPLWGHFLWNAGRTIADYLEIHKEDLEGRSVLELGAGAGLPSLICALNGASSVLVTDYPDADLIENLEKNCAILPEPRTCQAAGYLWGASTEDLKARLPESEREAGFDVLILADLLFNHSEHAKLVSSVQQTLKKDGDAQALVFFTPYRPWLLEKDLAFFDLARDGGFSVEKILEVEMDKVMFEEDPGDELLRRTVFAYRLRWSEAALKTG
ncbi:probable NNT1 Putative nicotinamide N-methyltransferase, has a role in rDNA silencing and in lifespan determination [Ramularia collo-cygni]|uniref:Protein N-terminal and lysine N-methyltransferase EFM7 n=1 Tax=Ramularia collo-cygni TaxID=112498 RepID=A0A2D3V7C1_9PEZI|nr:probable NNT1 Putative nicotinamide N-methyltransferase, has a role in rDNA silencing and in lifespan determination [Ramularia collo-cygni]CZT22790.1 probable NNT1 Putative nicotinamide N-methyltransferase, has a role in rDNA silencing and in lifespan determination [Ramularia collo-cygni]